MSPRLTIAFAVVLTLLATAAGLYWSGRRDGAARQQPRIAAAQAQAAVAGLETQGARDSARRVEVVVRQREAAAETVAKVTQQAVRSEDADAPLDEDRAARLRAADDELCDTTPELCRAADRDPR